MRLYYKSLTLKDKLAFLHMFKADASSGPAFAALCLIELDVYVSESELSLVFKDLGWPADYIEKLARLAPHHFAL